EDGASSPARGAGGNGGHRRADPVERAGAGGDRAAGLLRPRAHARGRARPRRGAGRPAELAAEPGLALGLRRGGRVAAGSDGRCRPDRAVLVRPVRRRALHRRRGLRERHRRWGAALDLVAGRGGGRRPAQVRLRPGDRRGRGPPGGRPL
ncbi:MAG: hypothetical protein AVDCRST_MAG35-804, partial [uncultured Quadrisphaera sp.]